MDLRKIGEFGLIRRLEAMAKQEGVAASRDQAFALVVGIGDDAAAWRIDTAGLIELSTTDTMVEEVHFTRSTTPWQDVGWKAMASNLSDLAAMGGSPTYALVTLGLPGNVLVEDVDAAFQGVVRACKTYGAVIAGGDVVSSPFFFITIALNGLVRGQPMLRSAAVPGDVIGVTGHLGLSRGGLELMMRHSRVDSDAARELVRAHRHPLPRLQEGHVLLEERVRAAMDVSDGLVDDLKKMMLASSTAARIFSKDIAIHPALGQTFPGDALRLALAGGEEYELLFTASGEVFQRVKERLPSVSIIGEVTGEKSGEVIVYDENGSPILDVGPGWDHLHR